LINANQKELSMQHAVRNRATIRVADRTDVSGRVTADEVNLDRFHNRIGKVCALVAARYKVYLSAATMILIVTLAVPASAQKQVLFSGAFQGLEIHIPLGATTVKNQGSTTGIATVLGQFSLTYDETVTLNTTPIEGTGTANLFNANGDSISMTIFETLTLPTTIVPPGGTPVGSIMGTYTIIGGTGRFARATGVFYVQRVSNLGGPTFTGGVIHDGTIIISNAENAQ
jgi:hypothetical protein